MYVCHPAIFQFWSLWPSAENLSRPCFQLWLKHAGVWKTLNDFCCWIWHSPMTHTANSAKSKLQMNLSVGRCQFSQHLKGGSVKFVLATQPQKRRWQWCFIVGVPTFDDGAVTMKAKFCRDDAGKVVTTHALPTSTDPILRSCHSYVILYP
jgi:hypothetical protein